MTPTTTNPGGRPTLAVLRSTPTRAYGAGVVLNPAEAAKRTPPSTTTGAWNLLEDQPAPDPIEHWLAGLIAEWADAPSVVRAAAGEKELAIARAEAFLKVVTRDLEGRRARITRPETLQRYQNSIDDAHRWLDQARAADATPQPAATVRSPTSVRDDERSDGVSAYVVPQGETFAVGLVGAAAGRTLVTAHVIAADPGFAAEIARAINDACKRLAARSTPAPTLILTH